MNPEILLSHFDRISDAPHAIPRLRQFILELAVRGKLVDRNLKDEPALALLKSIQVEKGRRIKAGQIKKRESLPEVQPEETWFDIPASWCWVRLGAITHVLMGQSPPGDTYNKTGEGIPLINGPVEFTEGPFGKTVINQYTTSPTNLCEEGDLLLCVRGSTTGRTNIAGFRACIGRGVAAIRPFFADQYIRLFIWRLRASIIAMGRGIAFPSVSRQQIEELPVPLPPLAEQHRIVAKVDDLMVLCDRLEVAQTDRERRRDLVAAASLRPLNNGTSSEAFRVHAHFYLKHFTGLTKRPEQIALLRQTILNLAVRGQLVRQEPTDEVASALARPPVGQTRVRRVQECVIEESPLNELPRSWNWYRLETISEQITDGEHATPPRIHEQQVPLVTAKNVRDGFMDYGNTDWVSYETATKAWRRCRPSVGDLLLVCVGATTGRLCVLRERRDMVLVRSVALIRPTSAIEVDYLALVLRSPFSQKQIWEKVKVTAQPCLYINRMKSLSIPLPPIVEQRRIVAKVDELMALCDGLEGQVATAQSARRRLLDAVLNEALSGSVAQIDGTWIAVRRQKHDPA
jgi:type I restriction enzyme S subunit